MDRESFLTHVRNTIFPAYDGPSATPDVELAKAVAVEGLKFIPVGMYGRQLYDQINRLWTTTACETPCIEWDEEQGKWMIWLWLRGPDEAYPSQYEVGGSPSNPGESYEDAIRRTVKKKFGVDVASFRELYQAAFFNQEERGWYRHLVFAVQYDRKPELSDRVIRVPVDELPENTCEHHRRLVIPAALAYGKNPQLYEAGDFSMRVSLGLEPKDEGAVQLTRKGQRPRQLRLCNWCHRAAMARLFIRNFGFECRGLRLKGCCFGEIPAVCKYIWPSVSVKGRIRASITAPGSALIPVILRGRIRIR